MRHLARLDLIDEGMVARLSRRQRARAWSSLAECLVGAGVALCAAWVAVEWLSCVAAMIP